MTCSQPLFLALRNHIGILFLNILVAQQAQTVTHRLVLHRTGETKPTPIRESAIRISFIKFIKIQMRKSAVPSIQDNRYETVLDAIPNRDAYWLGAYV